MFFSFIISLSLFFLPPLLICFTNRKKQTHFLVLLFLSIAISTLLTPMFSHQNYGIQKFSIIFFLTWLFTFILSKLSLESTPNPTIFEKFPLKKSLLTTSILWLSIFLIYGASGWSFQGMNWFHDGEAYFRPPFTLDTQRNVVITNGLLRGGESPYLPNTSFAYQLLWYHLSALIAGLFPKAAHYPHIAGFTLATSFTFIFILVTLFIKLRPEYFRQRFITPAILIILFFHGDLLNGIRGLISSGAITVNEVQPVYFRYVSFQSMSVVSPQHCHFMIFMLAFFVSHTQILLLNERVINFWRAFFFVLSFLSSPILSVLIFGLVCVSEFLSTKKIKIAIRALSLSILAFSLHYFILGYSAMDLFDRPLGESIFIPKVTLYWLPYLPLTWLAAGGISGLIFIILLVSKLPKMRPTKDSILLFLSVGVLIFNFFVTQSEIRRYSSMLMCTLLFLWIVQNLPKIEQVKTSFVWKGLIGFCASLALVSQIYFLKFFLIEPSTLSPTLSWEDYFKMNEIVKTDFAKSKIIAATSNELGLEKPFLMEVTTSFSTPAETAIHAKVSPIQLEILKQIHQTGNVLAYANFLGYDKILWGPVEEETWPQIEKSKYFDVNKPLATAGQVTLYQLKN